MADDLAGLHWESALLVAQKELAPEPLHEVACGRILSLCKLLKQSLIVSLWAAQDLVLGDSEASSLRIWDLDVTAVVLWVDELLVEIEHIVSLLFLDLLFKE